MEILQGFCAFALAVISVLLLRYPALYLRLVDVPGGRKNHEGEVPLIGGVAMFVALLSAGMLFVPLKSIAVFLLCAGTLVIVGLVDDRWGLSARAKSSAQGAVALAMIAFGSVELLDLGDLVFSGPVLLSFLSVPITAFAAVGVMNAMNMSDGMDGLAGGLALIALSFLALLASFAGRADDLQVLGLLIAVVAGFLVFNARVLVQRGRVFLGDAGSLLLGFALAWFTIRLSQGPDRAMAPVTALWLLAIPLLDTVSLLFQRALDGASPFKADRRHLHHLLQDFGFTVNQALAMILGLALLLATVGVAGHVARVHEGWMFLLFAALSVAYYIATRAAFKALTRRAGVEAPVDLDLSEDLPESG